MNPSMRPTRGQRAAGLLAALAGVVGIALVIISTPDGASLSPDANNYIAAARNLEAGAGLVRFDGSPFVLWPPLFPALLAILYKVGDLAGLTLHILYLMRWINALTLAAIVALSYRLYADHIRSRALVLVATWAVALAYPLIITGSYVWSEPLFIALCVAFMLRLTRALRREETAVPLGLAALAALACLQRYAGVTLVVAGVLAILLLARHLPFRKRVWNAGIFGAAAVAPLAVFLARNYHLTGTLTGARRPTARPLRSHINDMYNVLSAWITPDRLGIGYLWAGAITVVLLAVFAVWYYRRPGRRLARYLSLPMLLFVVTYTAFTIAGEKMAKLDAVDDRLMAPAYVFVIGLLFMALDQLVTRVQPTRYAAALIIGLAALWLVVPANRLREEFPTQRTISEASAETYHYWHTSPLIRQMQDDPIEGDVYTNAPLHVLVHTGIPARPVPAERAGWASVENKTRGPVYIIWFDTLPYCDYTRRHCIETTYTPGDLSAVEPVRRAPDGTVYQLTQR